MQFPKDFLWGTATSSYQIEGAVNEDGKGKSIWDVFTHVPGTVKDRSNGDVAIDHYHRFREDIRLMAKMGIRNYRFSISWGRILPDGTGAVNEKGLAFYSELVDCLLENGIRPFCTLYHWDLPYALHLRGGWLNPDMPEWFANYTTIVADALGDRVKDFITINEPQCIIGSGYALGVHAPGLKCCAADIVRAAHHLMLAHGRAVQMLRAHVPGVRVGYAPCGDPCVPYTNSPEDIAAARKEYFTVHIDEKVGPAWNIAWFSDPVMLGQYPADGLVGYEQYLPDGWQEDLKTIHQPLDFYGQNIYQGQWWRRGADGKPEHVRYPAGHPHNALEWPINEDGLYWAEMKRNVKPNKTKEDKTMVPVRRNQNWLPSIFNDFLGNDWLAERHNTTAPAVNIIEDENEYKVEVAAPGMTKEDFKVHINEDNELIVTMEKKAEQKEEDKKKGTYLRREFSYTKFQQSLLLPDNVVREKIAAKVENGVMTIEIPKKKETEAAVAARQIEVR